MATTKFFVIFVLAILVVDVFAATVFKKEKSASELHRTKREREVCIGNTPCGWAVYKKFTRIVEYFMRNECDCPPITKCSKHDDDLSVSAYVYRCLKIEENQEEKEKDAS